jgi:hypothetical protein
MREDELLSLITRRLPPDLVVAPPELRRYSDELVLVLQLDASGGAGEPEDQIARRRGETRALRMEIARELERATGLPVAWGMRVGDREVLFTTRTAPVMTRLGRAEREVLDTLVAAGVADTRSSALAYAVRCFALEHGEWLAEVRQAISEVQRVRARLKIRPRKGPPATGDPSVDA